MVRFYVVYRVGGTVNGKTCVSLAFTSQQDADAAAEMVRRGGREAHVETLDPQEVEAA